MPTGTRDSAENISRSLLQNSKSIEDSFVLDLPKRSWKVPEFLEALGRLRSIIISRLIKIDGMLRWSRDLDYVRYVARFFLQESAEDG